MSHHDDDTKDKDAKDKDKDKDPKDKDKGGGAVPFQIDPGMSVTVKSNNVTIAVIMETGSHPPTGFNPNTGYYWLVNALPSNATTIVLEIVSSQTPGSGAATFSISPPNSWAAGTPSNNATTFVDNTNGIAVKWNITLARSGWDGSATWYNTSQAPIDQAGTFTLTNNTSAVSTIQYASIDRVP